MGPRRLAREAAAHAGLHAVHVRRRCADIQHGHSLHAPIFSLQKRCCNQHRCVSRSDPLLPNALLSWHASRRSLRFRLSLLSSIREFRHINIHTSSFSLLLPAPHQLTIELFISVCSVRFLGIAGTVAIHSRSAEGCLHPVQRPDSRSWSLEV